MGDYVLDLGEVDRGSVALVGGKGAALGELSRIEGIRVPPGFCVTTSAFRAAAVAQHDVACAITSRVRTGTAYAVRSSATAEDRPGASFAGLHDTFLNVVGAAAILEHVRRCWASLSSERAVSYRARARIDHRPASMAVVVQEMVGARAAGVMFTADPVTSNRRLTCIEAGRGLGEGLVSGRVNAERYTVCDGSVDGEGVLTAAEVLELARLGRRIEAHFGHPQDIEWCLAADGFWIVQSRPITTLFPLPDRDDGERHVYVSVGHQQMMTDAMKPLGLSVWLMTTPRPMVVAGGRLFVDVARQLAAPASRAALLDAFASDPLTWGALETIARRGFVPELPDEGSAAPLYSRGPAPVGPDPALVTELIARSEASLAALKQDIAGRSGPELLDFIRADFEELRRVLFDPRSLGVIMAGMEAMRWLAEWDGAGADALARSVPNNVTSEMGLALLDVADAVRPHPAVVAFLESVSGEDFLASVPVAAARDALSSFLERYGMRCAGEIDITRPRWAEQPSALVPLILANVRNFAPGESRRRFERGAQEARARERELLARLRARPDGEGLAEEAKRMIDRVRTFSGYREYPKYAMVSRYFVLKQALLGEADRLVRAGVLRDREDVFYLTFDELCALVRSGRVDEELIRARAEAFAAHQALTPPRVFTSDGEIITGSYRREDVPPGALVGLAVSAGIAEGRARVLTDMARADLEPGDILVTTFTDPSWTPVFIGASALVTEVGGLMTHGAVIAREYGLPAVVGVERAAELIHDGDHIRVDGSHGYVEIVSGSDGRPRRLPAGL